MAARWLIVMSLPFWLVFEILPTKLPHYVLPAYPALAVLSAWGVLEWGKTGRIFTYSGAGFAVFGGAIIGAVLVYIRRRARGSARPRHFYVYTYFCGPARRPHPRLTGPGCPRPHPPDRRRSDLAGGRAAGMIAPATDLFPRRAMPPSSSMRPG